MFVSEPSVTKGGKFRSVDEQGINAQESSKSVETHLVFFEKEGRQSRQERPQFDEGPERGGCAVSRLKRSRYFLLKSLRLIDKKQTSR